MTSEVFLQKLEQGGLAPPEIVASLRRQVAAAKQPIVPATIAKLLVDKGHLTPNQAYRLLDAGGTASAAPKPAAPAPATKPAGASAIQKPAAAPVHSSSALDDLGLAPLDDLPEPPAKGPAKPAVNQAVAAPAKPAGAKPAPAVVKAPADTPFALDDLGLAPLDDLPELPATPAKAASAVSKAPAAPAKTIPAKPALAPTVTPIALDDLGLAPLDDLSEPTPAATPAKSASKPATAPAAKPAPANKPAIPVAPLSAPAPAASGLDDLTALDDLGSAGLDSLESLDSLNNDNPLGSAALDPFATPADLNSLSAPPPAAKPGSGTQPAPAAPTAIAVATENRQTLWVGIGIGSVALLVVIVGLALFLWPRGSGQEEFAAAEQAYQEKQYAAAIPKYDQLLKTFPNHDQASLAKVHRSMAAIHAAHSSPPDWPRLLTAMQQEAGTLASESAAAQIHTELAPLLLPLTEYFGAQLLQAKSADERQASAASVRASLALCNDARLLPANLRPWQKLAEIEESLQFIARDELRAQAREQARQTITTKLAAGDVQGALAARSTLLLHFPEVASEPFWQELAAPLAEAAQRAVKSSGDKRPAETAAAKSAVLNTIPWQQLTGQASGVANGTVVTVVAGGTIYALDESTGDVRWSRYLGCPANVASFPQTSGSSLLVDFARRELLQVSTQTGQLAWRQPLASDPVGAPLVVEGKAYVSLSTGELNCFDAASGELLAHAQLPQTVTLGLQATADGQQLIQVANEGLLYVLNAADLNCQRAVYLGHDAGSIVDPPLEFLSRLVMAENVGNQTKLNSISLTGSSAETKSQRVDGNVSTPLLVVGSRLLVPTLAGKIHVLEAATEGGEPLKLVSSHSPATAEPVACYLSASGGGLLCAGQGLSQLTLGADKKLQPAWSAVTTATFDAAAQSQNQTTIAVHHDAGQGITWATAVSSAAGAPRWQVPLSLPLSLVSRASGEALPLIIPWQNIPASPTAATSAIHRADQLGAVALNEKQLLLFAIGKSELSLVDSSEATGTAPMTRTRKLPGVVAGMPALCGQQLLVPLTDGTIACLNPQTGEPLAAPFALATKSADFSGLPSSPAAIVGSSLFVSELGGTLRQFLLPDLTPGPETNLSGARLSFGPHALGDAILFATSRDELQCLQADGSRRWRMTLTHGPFIGTPLVHGTHWLLLTQSGVVEVRAAETGELVQSIDCGQPLQGTSLLAGNTLWLPATSGQVLQLSLAREQVQP
ncbi:outer membrane biogenesis protein BamB [Anatilimnocola aggregata]|uniref:Outer membrane biogenesis protein BamB n=1 Tax=Anatilimnocola aggregata TaxID=2528021 RepID=A0A517YD75_9BACT|nr:PQQ-binding-like beta-propeller repeat protein [Anatilimnocola aggregata]QDU28190.1 outer membrane biogenesis protein BamB [Anatilimnocola aggregata]